MNWIYFPGSGETPDVEAIGGKALRLVLFQQHGFLVPSLFCLTTAAYSRFVGQAGLKERIDLELNRKELSAMRWEELWDAALRIRALFRATPFPGDLRTVIIDEVQNRFADAPLVIRSSAPAEDTRGASFAGLHETVVNVRGAEQVIDAVITVWASLFSNRALLYRQELGLNLETSTMAVIIQELVASDCSGIVFTRSPDDPDVMVIEAVYGQNQGLVDGDIEPDRWVVERNTRQVRRHAAPQSRSMRLVCATKGLVQMPVEPDRNNVPPLALQELMEIVSLAGDIEIHEGTAQDVEWTIADKQLYLLQARPITTDRAGRSSDNRSWYLSLHRSYDNLLVLWRSIEDEWLPAMDRDSELLAEQDLGQLTDVELADEIDRREQLNAKWTSVYWAEFIPFAHGVRLFGEFYNDVLQPDDPFEFVGLLSGEALLSTRRNDLLTECAMIVRENPDYLAALRAGDLGGIEEPAFVERIRVLREQFCLAADSTSSPRAEELLTALLNQYVMVDTPRSSNTSARKQLEQRFLERASPVLPFPAATLLALGRASYRLRDDDNMHIGRIAQQLERAVNHGRHRLAARGCSGDSVPTSKEVSTALRGTMPVVPRAVSAPRTADSPQVVRFRARQLTGQPASPGIATGLARVIDGLDDLHAFRKGDILVVDAIDPTMTFFAPLAAAIVERRGGMLIHGAIIAREYGIPCITGIADATRLIKTGDRLVVDGFLGIVTISHETP